MAEDRISVIDRSIVLRRRGVIEITAVIALQDRADEIAEPAARTGIAADPCSHGRGERLHG